ncbi:RodZ domain-containing protein [Halopseudomonas bauzanensis]|uniref:RodZ domain-containing protein n=1 Tax=Halopseudomonas bauzanensis TaxID=653930 RepID=UPI0025553F23|nr:RodZ domain-containing protein [Halopseudomonas bauzanensis]
MADEMGTVTGAENAGRVNPGALLRDERERVGFTADEVATHLRLTRATLGYLEDGKFDRLPGDTFARGYVRAYARLLKLDPSLFVAHYDRYVGIDTRESRVNTIDKVDVKPKRGARLVMSISTLLIVVIMVALGLWWWNVSREAPTRVEETGAMDEVQVDSMLLPDSFNRAGNAPMIGDFAAGDPAAGDPAAGAATNAEPAAEASSIEVETQQPAEAASPAPETGAEPATEAATDEVSSAAATAESAASESPVAASPSGLVMSFSANCWVQVSTTDGRVLHSRQMQQGQTLNIDRQGPLDLVIGAASAVSKIEYNGQPVELTGNASSGVARLRLGQ